MKRWIKLTLAFIAVLLMTVTVPITFSANTQLDIEEAQAELVDFVMYLSQSLEDLESYVDEELLENLEIELISAATVAEMSSSLATFEYTLGFLRYAYSTLLTDAIASELTEIEYLLDEIQNEEEDSSLVRLMQVEIENAETISSDILDELDELGIELDEVDNEEDEEESNIETSIRDFPDLSLDLNDIFARLKEVNENLVATYQLLTTPELLTSHIELFVDELEVVMEEFEELDQNLFTSSSWAIFQEEVENVEVAITEAHDALNEMNLDSSDDEEEDDSLANGDATRSEEDQLIELVAELRDILLRLIEVDEALASTYQTLAIPHIRSSLEINESVAADPDDEDDERYCLYSDDACLESMFLAKRFILHNYLMNITQQVRNVNRSDFGSGFWNELEASIQTATESLTNADLQGIRTSIQTLETFLRAIDAQ